MDAGNFHTLFKDCMPLFISLGDEVRLTIIEVLAQEGMYGKPAGLSPESISVRGMNVKEITEKTSLSRPAVSHHLKILKKAGMINARQEGTANYYYLTIGDSTKKLCSLGDCLRNLSEDIEKTTNYTGNL